MRRLIVAVALCALAGPAYTEDTALARECNAIAWEVPLGAADDMPPALRAVQRRLLNRPRGSIDAVIRGMPHSLHLRRIAPRVLTLRAEDRTRRALLTLLQDDDAYVAREAATALGRIGGREVLPALRAATRDRPASVRHDAINALASLGAADEAAVDLLKALDADAEAVVRSGLDALSLLRGEANQRRALERIESLLARSPAAAVARDAHRSVRVLRARLTP